jgi:hypothetical protein
MDKVDTVDTATTDIDTMAVEAVEAVEVSVPTVPVSTVPVSVPVPCYFVDGPPLVTWRQAELYGLVRYDGGNIPLIPLIPRIPRIPRIPPLAAKEGDHATIEGAAEAVVAVAAAVTCREEGDHSAIEEAVARGVRFRDT